MKIQLACAFALLAAGCAPGFKRADLDPAAQDTAARKVLGERLVSGWSEHSRLAARALIEKYGAPDELHTSRVVWNRRAPWRRIVVRDEPPPYSGARTEELGVVEQTVEYSMTPQQAQVLEAFGRTLSWNAGSKELTARSDSEAVNFLRVNLADEVVNGRLTVEQAREAYARLMHLEESGKTTGYMSDLHFMVPDPQIR